MYLGRTFVRFEILAYCGPVNTTLRTGLRTTFNGTKESDSTARAHIGVMSEGAKRVEDVHSSEVTEQTLFIVGGDMMI